MSFSGAASDYERFMGRYSRPLAVPFADFAGVVAGMTVLDVGCGTGALTAELVARVGAASTHAVDPSPGYVAATRIAHPDVDVREASAEQLPFDDDSVDAALAELVVHFMKDPVVGLREMARVTKSGGTVAACVWDHAGGGSPLSPFWDAVKTIDPRVTGEAAMPGASAGQLAGFLQKAGLDAVTEQAISVQVVHPTFDDWWQPYLAGTGPAGAYVARLIPGEVERLRTAAEAHLPPFPLTLTASAWAARGTVR
jgi:SAM-dependent methyltransferase